MEDKWSESLRQQQQGTSGTWRESQEAISWWRREPRRSVRQRGLARPWQGEDSAGPSPAAGGSDQAAPPPPGRLSARSVRTRPSLPCRGLRPPPGSRPGCLPQVPPGPSPPPRPEQDQVSPLTDWLLLTEKCLQVCRDVDHRPRHDRHHGIESSREMSEPPLVCNRKCKLSFNIILHFSTVLVLTFHSQRISSSRLTSLSPKPR